MDWFWNWGGECFGYGEDVVYTAARGGLHQQKGH